MIAPEEHPAFRKVARRLIPLMMVLYLVSFLDRVNVGFAALTMNADLDFSPAVYGFGASIFFLGYFLFEVPSNLIMEKVGARLWICRIMVTWGLLSAATAFVTGPTSFYVVRFLLGVAEAGFLPGMILYLGYWFPLAIRGRTIALFMAAVPIASAVGAPLSGMVLQTHGFLGLAGWQWLFLIEGIPACLLGIVVLIFLPDGPQQARWLSGAEKQAIAARLAADAATDDASTRHAMGPALRDPRVIGLGLIYFGLVMGLYGVGLWLPQMVQARGYAPGAIGWILVLPYALSAVAMLAWGRHSDRTGERVWHVAGPLLLGGVGLVASIHAGSDLLALGAITVASMGIYATLGPFWTLPPLFLRGTAAAAGIALINAIGNLGGVAGPYVVGLLRQASGGYGSGLEVLALALLLAGVLALALGRVLVRRPDGRAAQG
ncbi:MFS transporter [Azorhizobium sp. AG788]|uniref:MFS transporter n=1 Tax=Azorhizobium sp. AG788 TaxID=2183897 RepID=UPI003138FBC5